LGSALVAKLLARGDDVSVTVLNDAEEAAVRAGTPNVSNVYRLDLSDADTVREALAVEIDGEALDAVAVCAAISPYGPIETTPIALVRRTLEINLLSHIAIYQAVMPALRRSQGRIVFTSSMAGIAAMPFIGAYVASKFALEGVADVMRREAKTQGVHVALVEPGSIRTPMVSHQLETLVTDIAALSDEERDCYGHLYRGFQTLATQSHQGDASPPELIADALLEALDAGTPAARYVAGADAEQLVALARDSSDEAMDTLFIDMFEKAGAA
jgi:NAD(P)-dependent dehydrogenase (short-subunit alcohol dehydrogenase family)